jgi:hypothetical protein
MKTVKPPAKTSAAKISAAKPPALPWLERPSLDMGLRIGTAAMMAIAATLVLAHLTVYSLSLTNANFSRLQSSACYFARC